MLFPPFPDTARVWVYQANRLLTATEATAIQAAQTEFVQTWASHGRDLTADGALLHHLFIVFVVDEAVAGASGCSIDKSVAFVRGIAEAYKIDFFDRMIFAFRNDDNEVALARRDSFAAHYQHGLIDDDTVVFDTLVETLGALRNGFEKPLAESWHKRMVKIVV